jgi:uncharacterized protein YbbK (DUF523 family)
MPRPRRNLARDETEVRSHRAGIQANDRDLTDKFQRSEDKFHQLSDKSYERQD